MSLATADLCDQFSEQENFQIAEPTFQAFGKNKAFNGQITTMKVFEDNSLVRKTLEEKVDNRVLVIDGGGSRRCALLGDNLAGLACRNGWQGIIVYGCIRDSAAINQLPIGIRALSTHPLKSHKRGLGDRDVMINFAGIHFKKDQYLYADEDGIIVSDANLG
ncbi:ribonuclease E activity regulator RraA [Methylomarinum sp. Ch1-1]|uniref:4-hydroxy-4-methyl-2-oxoglutarate aldolase n=1 Tax=Methylomarinum roseum TaxID=3067653 RepID=A0AAU7NUE4_9GAMM|nr:ribonuclease E activity regulator RraA [Methylomarinum sp. Ch1-1]MDP4519331.1 ribonuclease E activity regulator RraA [Methylomarinum sp. Ch1-1]